jgi:glucose-6-phosphate isomerase
MTVSLNEKFVKGFIDEKLDKEISSKTDEAMKKVIDKNAEGNDFLGWADLPDTYDKEEFARIKVAAEKIKGLCDVLIVIGIGGSYLGARAAVEFIKSPNYNALKKDTPDIYFAGRDISPKGIDELFSICHGRHVCINVISKSGTTTEPAIAFRIFHDFLVRKYGKYGAKERIFVTTDKAKGTLKSFADNSGYETFVVPDDIGGRYSVLTAVGLLPIAVAGVDIDKMMKGAQDARNEFLKYGPTDCVRYAALRNILLASGKSVEILAVYDPALQILCEWWKQLFGESEGKEGKGIFPASGVFSTDLHSLGQYIQDGKRQLFETVISVKDQGSTLEVPFDIENVDGLNFVAGKKISEINSTAMTGTLLAHNDGGVPNILLEIADRSEYTFGYLVYFFELACAVSGYMLGVNPFNQPGVEAYKKNMFALLGKSGYEEERKKLSERL